MIDLCKCGHPRRAHADSSGLCWVGFSLPGAPCDCMVFSPAITLRAWTDADVDAYEAIICAPEVVEFLGEPDSDPVPSTTLLWSDDVMLSLTAAVCRGDEVVGYLIAFAYAGDTAAEVTLAIRPDVQGQGIGRAAIAVAAKMLRKERPGLQLTGTVNIENARSRALVQGLGGHLVPHPDNDGYFAVASTPRYGTPDPAELQKRVAAMCWLYENDPDDPDRQAVVQYKEPS